MLSCPITPSAPAHRSQRTSPLGQAVGSGDDLVLDAPDEDHRARVLAVDDRISRHDPGRHEVALQEEGAVVVDWWWWTGGGGAAAGVVAVVVAVAVAVAVVVVVWWWCC